MSPAAIFTWHPFHLSTAYLSRKCPAPSAPPGAGGDGAPAAVASAGTSIFARYGRIQGTFFDPTAC